MLSPDERRAALKIARDAIASRLAGKPLPPPEISEIPPFNNLAASFVTLKKRGALRGCIGNIIARMPLWRSIQNNALSAAFGDPRFPELSSDEFDDISIEVSVLSKPHPISSYGVVIGGEHGVIMELGRAGAVFLPQVALEQGWGPEETLTHLSLKAGLRGDAWRSDDARFEVFEAEVFGEVEP